MKKNVLFVINNIMVSLVPGLAMFGLATVWSLYTINEPIMNTQTKVSYFNKMSNISLKVFIISVLFVIVTMLINNIFEEKNFKKGHIIIMVLLSLLVISLIVFNVYLIVSS